MAPPCPLRAKRLPFGLSRRMMRPQSTRAARCRRSVAAAIPCARSASCWFDGNTIRPSPLNVVSGWKLSKASRTANARSEAPTRALDVQIARNTCHLCTAFSGGRAFATAWLATWASVSDRRPKGVVELWGCIFNCPQLGKRNPLTETALSLSRDFLTVIRGSEILNVLRLRRASGTRFGGLFLLRSVSSCFAGTRFTQPTVSRHRPARSKLWIAYASASCLRVQPRIP